MTKVAHKASPSRRRQQIIAVWGGLERKPNGRLTANALARWRGFCESLGIGSERAKQIMHKPVPGDMPANVKAARTVIAKHEAALKTLR